MSPEHPHTTGGNGDGPPDRPPPRMPRGAGIARGRGFYLAWVLLMGMARTALESGGRLMDALQALLLLAFPILLWRYLRRK